MDTIYALMRHYGMNYGQARDALIAACMGDASALPAVVDITPMGVID